MIEKNPKHWHVYPQFHQGGSVIQCELMQVSGACNFTLRHSQLLLIHLLMPSDLPAGHRRRGLQSSTEMEGEKREIVKGKRSRSRNRVTSLLGKLVYLDF